MRSNLYRYPPNWLKRVAPLIAIYFCMLTPEECDNSVHSTAHKWIGLLSWTPIIARELKTILFFGSGTIILLKHVKCYGFVTRKQILNWIQDGDPHVQWASRHGYHAFTWRPRDWEGCNTVLFKDKTRAENAGSETSH